MKAMRWRRVRRVRAVIAAFLLFGVAIVGYAQAERRDGRLLEIHYINAGQGGSTLIVGPDGTTILYDFGAVAGRHNIVPYLKETAHLRPENGIHFAIVSHADKDHYMGYRDVVDAGFDILIANYEPGTDKKQSATMLSNWLGPAKQTRAKDARPIPVGLRIALGDGAEAIVVAANGVVLGEDRPTETGARNRPLRRMNENDRSIALFVRYGSFHYLIDGDLGSGPELCTGHETNQRDVQTRVARALIAFGLMPERFGVDVLHIAHHGSESSTSAAYYRLMKPEVGLISVGPNQGSFLHPRVDVVEKVLTCKTQDGHVRVDACKSLDTLADQDTRADCARDDRTPALRALFQTDNGLEGCSSTGCTSFAGMVVGDIKLTTDGKTGYSVVGSGRIANRMNGRNVPADLARGWTFPFDESTELRK